jgi:hypothetical protein
MGIATVTCKYCRKPVCWVLEGEKYRPKNQDNSPHDCQRKGSAPTGTRRTG